MIDLNKELLSDEQMKGVEGITDVSLVVVVLFMAAWGAADEEVLALFGVSVVGMALVLLTRRLRVVAWLFRILFVAFFGFFFYNVLFRGATW
jgi:hypothetical protein